MVKTVAIIFGIVFLLAGVLGFVPGVTPDGQFLGVLHINSVHNIIHILTGIIALVCGFMGAGASRGFFKIFGIIYALVAILGFFYGDADLLGLVGSNMADSVFHAIVAVVSLALGFGGGSRQNA